MKKLIIALITASFLTSCGSGTPSCSDSDVKDLAYEIFEEDFSSAYRTHLKNLLKEAEWETYKQSSDDLEELRMAYWNWRNAPDYGKVEEYDLKDFFLTVSTVQNEELTSQLETLAKMVWEEDVKYELVNIRLDGTDDDIKKCECSAEMEFKVSQDGLSDLGMEEDMVFKTRTVLFDAQNTEDQLLVWFDFEN